MSDELYALVEEQVDDNVSPQHIRATLTEQGYDEDEVDNAIYDIRSDRQASKREQTSHVASLFTKKEVVDRVGYGFVPHQFINILFYMIGAGYFWVGIINGAKNVLSAVLSSVFQEYSDHNLASKHYISTAGYVFGFSFLGMGFAVLIESVPLFACFLLLSSLSVASHGDLYDRFVKEHLKQEQKNTFLARISTWGVVITGVSMLVSGWLLDTFPKTGAETVTLLGSTYPVYGYLISFEITAFAFILSGYFISSMEAHQDSHSPFLTDYMDKLRVYLSTFMRNKKLLLLIVASIIVGFVQGLGNSYYGIFIYYNFTDVALGGFLNVGAVFFLAVLASLVGAPFCKKMEDTAGLAPTLVFGTLLTAMMPFVLAYNPQLWAVGAAAILTVVGSSILGVSQGLLARQLLREDERRVYFSTVSVAGAIPYLILFPLGSWYASVYGLTQLFKVLGLALVVLAVPIYLVLVFMSEND